MSQRWHTIVTTVENKPGVLARVAGLFSRRGFNIHSLAVAPTDDERFSRITIVVDVESAPLDQISKQLDKLINVVQITELDPSGSVERELILATVGVAPGLRTAVLGLVESAGATVLDEAGEHITVSLVDDPGRVDAFEELLAPHGILTVQRTGRVALPALEG